MLRVAYCTHEHHTTTEIRPHNLSVVRVLYCSCDGVGVGYRSFVAYIGSNVVATIFGVIEDIQITLFQAKAAPKEGEEHSKDELGAYWRDPADM